MVLAYSVWKAILICHSAPKIMYNIYTLCHLVMIEANLFHSHCLFQELWNHLDEVTKVSWHAINRFFFFLLQIHFNRCEMFPNASWVLNLGIHSTLCKHAHPVIIGEWFEDCLYTHHPTDCIMWPTTTTKIFEW